jgi:hypothetical protein
MVKMVLIAKLLKMVRLVRGIVKKKPRILIRGKENTKLTMNRFNGLSAPKPLKRLINRALPSRATRLKPWANYQPFNHQTIIIAI